MYKTTALFVILSFILSKASGQEIIYGSNSGKYLSISDTQIYYEEYGSGVPLLLLHGGFGSIHDFQQVIPELANHFRVIAMDSPGHGRSEQADSLSFDLMANYCSELIDQLQLDSAYIIGYSDGGITGLLLAAHRPTIVKRVLASGANSRMSEIVPEMLGIVKMISPDFIETYQKEWLEDYQSKSPEKNNWGKFITDIATMYSLDEIISQDELSGITSKVLLVFGDKDVIKLEHGLELYHSIPKSSLCILPDTPHEVFSKRPGLVNKIGISFFRE